MRWVALPLLVQGGLVQQCSRGDEVFITSLDRGLQDVAARLVHVAGIDEYHVRFVDHAVQVTQCPDLQTFETHPNCVFTNEEVRRNAASAGPAGAEGPAETGTGGTPCAVEGGELHYARREEAAPVERVWIPSGMAMALAGIAAAFFFAAVTRWVFQAVGADLGENYAKHSWAYAGTSPAAAALSRAASLSSAQRQALGEDSLAARKANPRCAWPTGERLRVSGPSVGPPVVAWEAPGVSAAGPSRYRPSVRLGGRPKPPPLVSV